MEKLKDYFVGLCAILWKNTIRAFWRILNGSWELLRLIPVLLRWAWGFAGKLGGISLLFSVITFWIIQHNEYVATGNSIRAETQKNAELLNVILIDEKRNWGYLRMFSTKNYESNWNYIAQYYSHECLIKMRDIAQNAESANTLIVQRQIGNKTLGQNTLYETAQQLEKDFEYLGKCEMKPWWNSIWYTLY